MDHYMDLSPASVHAKEFVHSKFFNGHGQFSDVLLNKLMSTCNFTFEKLHGKDNRSKACTEAIKEKDRQIGGYNV